MENEIGSVIIIFVLQIMGLGVAFWSVSCLRTCTNVNSSLSKRMYIFLGITSLVTVVMFVINQNILQLILNTIKSDRDLSVIMTTCNTTLAWYALADLVALGVLIHATGGSAKSMYLPYLLIIVPLIAMLNASHGIIIICFLCTLAVFGKGYLGIKNGTFNVTEEKIYDRFFGAITLLCVLFPMGIHVIFIK